MTDCEWILFGSPPSVCSFSELKFCSTRGNILCSEEAANSRLSTGKYVYGTWLTINTMLVTVWSSTYYAVNNIISLQHKAMLHCMEASLCLFEEQVFGSKHLPSYFDSCEVDRCVGQHGGSVVNTVVSCLSGVCMGSLCLCFPHHQKHVC